MTKTAHPKTTAMMVLAALAAGLLAMIVAYTPASARTVADAKPPRVIEVRPAEGAIGVSPPSTAVVPRKVTGSWPSFRRT